MIFLKVFPKDCEDKDMTKLLKGKEVCDRLMQTTLQKTEKLKAAGVQPVLAIVRVGENHGDIAYERGALKSAAQAGIEIRHILCDADIKQEKLEEKIHMLNDDDEVHGVLIFRPLPAHIDEKAICDALAARKDVDGITAGSMAGVFMDSHMGFPPCTAEACMELLDYYGYDLTAKKVTVMGRSLVIGKPVAMMAMRRDATVTICHSRTSPQDVAEAGRNADIIIAAVGRAKMINSRHIGSGQTIIDVGINMGEDGRLCGDVDFDDICKYAEAITPVPGGVGSVTTAVLMKHVAEAAEEAAILCS